MTQNSEQSSDQDIEVSFAQVAAEPAEESVAHEVDAIEDVADTGGVVGVVGAADANGEESENDSPPPAPTLTSLAGGGPVHEGGELAP